MRNWKGASALALTIALAGCDNDTTTSTPTATATPSSTVNTASAGMMPASASTGAYIDTRLQMTFDAPPAIGGTGLIRVFKSDGTLVDTIDLGSALVASGGETQTVLGTTNTEIDKIGNNVASLTQYRFTYYRPVTVAGNVATIKLHDNVLAYDTSYYVTVDQAAFGGRRNGAAFAGVTSPAAWTFRTKSAPASATSVTVDDDGTADFRSVQGAFDYLMGTGCLSCANAAATKTVLVKNGTYDEQLFLRNISNLTVTGESRAGTIVQSNNWEAFNPGVGGSRAIANTTTSAIGGSSALGTRRALGGGRATLLVEGGDLLRLSNFTLGNTHVKEAAQNSQSETIYYNSANLNGSRFIGTDMNFIGTQDTIQMKGWVWIYNSLVAGDVDFVWGYPYALLLENSELRTRFDPSAPTSGGYVFQARSAKGYPGFVVLGGSLTSEATVPAGSTYLARSSGVTQAQGYCQSMLLLGATAGNNTQYCDNVAYIGVRMGTHIAPAGWFINPLPNLAPTASEGWRESGTLDANGAPLTLTAREKTYATSIADLSALNARTKVFAQWNGNAGWTPAP